MKRRSKIERALVPWTPCMVTALRIALAPIIAYLFVHQFVAVAVALFLIAVWTDWLDGVLATALGVKSDLGAFLDATTDKLLILPVLFAAGRVMEPTLRWWVSFGTAFWILAAIEVALTALRLPRLFSPHVNVHAGEMGKWKFFAEIIAVLEVMVLGSAEFLPVAIGLGVLSLIEHLVHYRKS